MKLHRKIKHSDKRCVAHKSWAPTPKVKATVSSKVFGLPEANLINLHRKIKKMGRGEPHTKVGCHAIAEGQEGHNQGSEVRLCHRTDSKRPV